MNNDRQFGGTLLGVVLGLVAGLVAALLVAVYVTKVPVPFLDGKRVGNAAADRDATEAKKNKDWDPNGPLASKGAVLPTPPVAETPQLGGVRNPTALPPLEPPPPAASVGAASAPAAVVAKVDPRARGTAMTDPLGDLARTRGGADSSNSNSNSNIVTSPADSFAYFVQAGAFRGATEADAQRAKLAIMGWEAQVTEREQAGRTMFRVRVGPYGRKDDAERVKERLDDAGLPTALVRVRK